MGSAGSSLKGGDIDGISQQWTSQLYFDPEAVKSSGPTYWIEHGELRTKLKEPCRPHREDSTRGNLSPSAIQCSDYKLPLLSRIRRFPNEGFLVVHREECGFSITSYFI